MTNRTTNQGQRAAEAADQCPTFTWCDEGCDHSGDPHHGDADMSPVTATADRTVFVREGFGLTVPEVGVDLHADPGVPAQDADLWVTLTIERPPSTVVDVRLTLAEADYLRRHLVQVLSLVEHEPAMQDWLANYNPTGGHQ